MHGSLLDEMACMAECTGVHKWKCACNDICDAMHAIVCDPRETYLMKESAGGMCVITSCTYTVKELQDLIESSKGFVRIASLHYEQFSYGGSVGSKVVTEVFRRKT